MKKKFTVLLSVVFMILLLSLTASAAEAIKLTDIEEENVYYSYDAETKTLTLSGTGAYTTNCGDSEYSGWGGVKFESFYALNDYRKKTEKVVIEDGITVIGGGSFAHFENLKSVEIPSTVTEIQPYAFYECYNLESITLPESLEKIGFEAFRSCRKLTELIIPENVKEIQEGFIVDAVNLSKIEVDSENPYLIAENNVLYNKDKTTLITVAPKQSEVIIPSTVTQIYDFAFALSSVKEIVIPATVTDFGKATFYKSAIEKITFEEGINIKEIASFEKAYGDETDEDYGAFEGCTNLKRLSIPDSVKTFGRRAEGHRTFGDCTSLEYLYIGKNVKDIDSNSFINCKSLKKIKVHKDNKNFYVKKGALYQKIKEGKKTEVYLRFVPVTKASFKIPANVTNIGRYAFANGKLEKINIPKNVTSIGNGAFYNCKKLKAVTFAKNSKVTYVGWDYDGCSYNNCMYDKTDLDEIPVFYNCKKLKRVNFPDSVLNTAMPLFDNCNKLRYIQFGKDFGSDDEIFNVFDNYFRLAVTNCKNFISYTFTEDNERYTYSDGIVYSKDKTKIHFYARNNKAKTFIIPEGVTQISDSAFKGCKHLKRIKFVHNAEKFNIYSFGTNAFGKKTVLVKKNSEAHKALKNYQENYLCKVNIKFY